VLNPFYDDFACSAGKPFDTCGKWLASTLGAYSFFHIYALRKSQDDSGKNA
jgi:hypothetical protein